MVVFVQITQQVFVAKEWFKSKNNLARAKANSNDKANKIPGTLKEEHANLTNKFTVLEWERLSVVAGLKSAETQAEDQCKKLHAMEIELATEK